jgi:hypothetical protein
MSRTGVLKMRRRARIAALKASLRRVMRRRLPESGARVGFSFITTFFITNALKTEDGRR